MRRWHPGMLGGAALAVLVALAWLQWRHDRAHAPGTLLGIDPASVVRIEIDATGQPPLAYRRRDGQWWTDGTHPARAQNRDGWLDRVAAIADAPVLRWRSLRQLDPRTLGLDPPQLTLVINGRRLDYGVMAPFAAERYVRVGPRVAVVPAQYAPPARPPVPVTAPQGR